VGRGSTISVEAQGAGSTAVGSVSTIDGPGATVTLALDINAEGFIVGRYLSTGRTHGFLRDPDGELTTIDVPGSVFTVTTSINNSGAIVGQYALPSAPGQRHGFLLMDGEFTTIDPPGSTFTNALGINERGDIVGRFCTKAVCRPAGSGDFHGFILRHGELTIVDVPGAAETDLLKIADREQVLGGQLMGGTEQLFILSRNVLTPLAIPAGTPTLDIGGINERGDVVGSYCDTASPCLLGPTGTHGFLVSADTFMPIDIAGALATAAIGINARGDIVGSYTTDDGKVHGFLITRGV
jgi:uncharacterized membrane protein